MKMQGLMTVAALAAAAGSASAQITPVGPFTGPYMESFETQNPACPPCFFQCVPNRIFNNTADVCDSTGGANMNVTSGWSFFCTIFPNSGGRFAASAGGPAKVTFDNPVNRFGGYFGTNSGVDGAVCTFYDNSNNVIGTQNMTTSGCTWTWNGWESATPIKSVLLAGNNPYGGGFIDMDDLQYQIGGTGPTGACCLADGSCIVATSSGCTSLSGTYRGDNTTCATANCPQPPTGACCLDIGCALRTQAQCTAGAGTYRGDNTACAGANCPAPTAWLEQGDAGSLPGTAQAVTGSGSVTAIRGTLTAGDADMYRIDICNEASFDATLVGGATFNTQLFLFNTVGAGLVMNDDNPAGGSQQAHLTSAQVFDSGQYLLAVTAGDNDPLNAASQEIWADSPLNEERVPDGPGAPGPVTSWNGATGSSGAYVIRLAGTCFIGQVQTCYANCDHSTTAPCLNVLDFTCFLNQFAAASSYANCDNSTQPPVLNVLDFTCFLNRFAAGCSGC